MISKRWLINFLLIMLIILLTYIGNRYEVQTGFQTKDTISSLKLQDIKRIAIQTADQSFMLRRTSTQWYFESPIEWPANNITMERLLSIAKTEFESSLPADEIDLATVGLQFPTAILTLNDTRFLFGATNNIGNRRYVMTGPTIYLIPDIHLSFFTPGLPGLVDRRLLPRSLALGNLNLGKFSLSKSSNGSWQEDGGAFTPDRINSLVNNWQTLEASSIKPYQKSNTPIRKITAALEDGSEIEFFLMSISPEIVIARPDLGLQYHFAESRFYGLLAVAQE